MGQNKFEHLREIGQSLWLDYIRRSFLEAGKLKAYVDQGLGGVTSNPSIFKKAIAGSDDYDEQLRRLVDEGKSTHEIYEALVVQDIQNAADTLRPVYAETNGVDGYVSLEVRPELAHETASTIEEVRHLLALVDRPNVMIKIPATEAGIPAIQTMIAEGRNINVTLMFSLEQYEAVAEAYITGLEALAAQGGDVSSVASVASFFVSRVDVMVDEMLDNRASKSGEAEAPKGKIGIANAKLAYERFKQKFSGERWERLAAQGARVQRVLYGSTSTKNPNYPDTLYVDNLIGPHTVNTIPPETLEAFLDHGTVARTLDKDLDAAKAQLAQLDALGIDLDDVTRRLLLEGIEKFEQPFKALMESIEQKCKQLEPQSA